MIGHFGVVFRKRGATGSECHDIHRKVTIIQCVGGGTSVVKAAKPITIYDVRPNLDNGDTGNTLYTGHKGNAPKSESP